jgi:hypothetical protein
MSRRQHRFRATLNEVLEDLLAVMERLCPVWPDKDIPRVTVGYLL